MAVIVRSAMSPPDFMPRPHGALYGVYGSLGKDHPTLRDYVWVDWFSITPGYYPRRMVVRLGVGFTDPTAP